VDIGFIGLGHMGSPMARRLIDGLRRRRFRHPHRSSGQLVALGGPAGRRRRRGFRRRRNRHGEPAFPIRRAEVAAVPPVWSGAAGCAANVDLSTIGRLHRGGQIHDVLADRNIVAIDSPVRRRCRASRNGTLR